MMQLTLLLTFLLLIIHYEDREAEYIIMPPEPVNQYNSGEILALAVDADGPIIASAISEGNLPAGIELADNSTMLVTDHTKLAPGSYPLEVVTVDEQGGMSTHHIQISFLTAGKADREAGYKAYPSKLINEYKNEEVILHPTDPDGEITGIRWISGNLPTGTAIQPDGKVVVTDQKTLEAGTYDIQLITYDEAGHATLFSLTFTLLDKKNISPE